MKLFDQIMRLPDEEKLKLAIQIIESVQQSDRYPEIEETLRMVEEKLEEYGSTRKSVNHSDEESKEEQLSALTTEQLADLMERNSDFERNPEEGIGWEELKEKIISGKWRSE